MISSDTPARTRLAKDNLCDRAVTNLREMIVRGEMKPGFAIRENSLSQALNISRTPLREALKILEAEGFVSIRKNRGARVSNVNLAEAYEFFEAAAGIERYAAELATMRHSATEFWKLEALQISLERAYQAGKLEQYFEINQRIHLSIVSLAGNATIRSMHADIFSHIRRLRHFALNADFRWHDSVEEHRLILDAFRRRDPQRAGALMERHVLGTGRAIEQLFQHQSLRTNPASGAAGSQTERRRNILLQESK